MAGPQDTAAIVYARDAEAWASAVAGAIAPRLDSVEYVSREPSQLWSEAVAQLEIFRWVVLIEVPGAREPSDPQLVLGEGDRNRFFVLWGIPGESPQWLHKFRFMGIAGQQPEDAQPAVARFLTRYFDGFTGRPPRAPKEAGNETRASQEFDAIIALPWTTHVMGIWRGAVSIARPSEGKHEITAEVVFEQLLRSGGDPPEEGGQRNGTPDFVASWIARQAPAAFEDWRRQIARRARESQEVRLIVVEPDAVAAANRSREILAATSTDSRISSRHLLAAMLVPEARRIAPGAAHRFVERTFGLDLDAFVPEWLDWLRARPGENGAPWQDVLRPALDALAQKRASPALVGYAADQAEADAKRDVMQINADVEAFAELICLKDARPPLSIGLFGQWGAGKTTFMDRLAARIGTLAASQRDRPESPFVGNVVQIKFNAWTFADSNLWASLTNEFFEQLRLGGFEQKGQAAYQDLVANVAAEVAKVDTQTAALATQDRSIQDEIGRKQAERTRLEAERRTLPAQVLQRRTTAALDAFIAHNAASLRTAAKALGIELGDGDLTGEGLRGRLGDVIAEIQDVRGRSLLVWQAVVGSWRERRWLLTLWPIAFVLAAIAAVAIGPAAWKVAGLLFPVAAAVAVQLYNAFAIARPFLDAGRKLAVDVKRSDDDLASRIADIDRAVESLKTEAARVRAAQDLKRAKLDVYRSGPDGYTRGALLHFFLHESELAKGYDQHLGLLSRVRRAFETLDSIMSRNLGQGGQVERIVVYIDDLDRCPDDVVVKVLEAAHLLLAFRSFVVVVGVDERWLTHSLLKHYRTQLGSGAGKEAAAASAPASPQDYLEKIFQIPFWIRPLSFGGDKGGTYDALIDSLVGPPPAADVSKTKPPPIGQKLPPGQRNDGNEGDAISNSRAEEVPPPPPPPPPPPEQRRDPMRLSDPETKLLKALGPLAGKSPRAAKRMINIYRLMRGRRSGTALAKFLGQDGSAEFPAILLLLGLDTGLKEDALRAAVELIALEDVFAPLESLFGNIYRDRTVTTEYYVKKYGVELAWIASRLDSVQPFAPLLEAAASAASAAYGSRLLVNHVHSAVGEMSRYSFRRSIYQPLIAPAGARLRVADEPNARAAQ